ncbi:MAG: tetratricopeptide repeat protein [Alphaproteobacteria bacterium]|nr:tetratricopeptide repeat protein [Alphaproteobacteria bacterium]
MADAFQEVDEALAQDRLRASWHRYGPFVIGGAALFVFVCGAVLLWRDIDAKQRAEASDRYIAAAETAEEGQLEAAIGAFGEIASSGPGGYPALAALQRAVALREAGNAEGALAAFDTVSPDRSLPAIYRDLARLSAAMMVADTSSMDDLTGRLTPLLGDHPLRHFAYELLAFAAYREGDYAAARDNAQFLVEDAETPQDMRGRAGKILALVAEEGPLEPEAASEPGATSGEPAAEGASTGE